MIPNIVLCRENVMKGKIILIILFTICAISSTARADYYFIVDQSHMANVDSWHNLSYHKFAQEFLPSFSSMDTVDVAIHTNEGAILRLNIRDGSVDGYLIGTSEELYLPPLFTDMAHFIFASPVPLVPGDSYIIDVRLVGGSADIASSFEGGGYSEGRMFIDGINTPTDDSDIIFRTGLLQSDLIEIKKGGNTLCGNTNGSDRLRIAILSSDLFDATTVNPDTVSFGGADIKKDSKNGIYFCHEEDTNNDGLLDLVCRIDSTQMVIKEGSSSIVVKAETVDGLTVIGEEDICGAEKHLNKTLNGMY